MNLFKDIKEIVGENGEVGFEIDTVSLTIWFSLDVSFGESHECIIPISYYIDEEIPKFDTSRYFEPNNWFIDKLEPSSCFGFTIDELKIMNEICEYIKQHESEIVSLMESFCQK